MTELGAGLDWGKRKRTSSFPFEERRRECYCPLKQRRLEIEQLCGEWTISSAWQMSNSSYL